MKRWPGQVIKRLLSSDATAGMGAERMAAAGRAGRQHLPASLDGAGRHVAVTGAGISAG
ncbi:hypothetical protein OIU92_00125 [Escherichia coli]|nr:hypothetical protein [Escherichia coli]